MLCTLMHIRLIIISEYTLGKHEAMNPNIVKKLDNKLFAISLALRCRCIGPIAFTK
jgi:hypothetical protein